MSHSIYSCQNDDISPMTRREIARIAGCIRALVESGVKVDEHMVMKAYEASLEAEMEDMVDQSHESQDYLGGERGKRVVAQALAANG